jgi:hypothetical protein
MSEYSALYEEDETKTYQDTKWRRNKRKKKIMSRLEHHLTNLRLLDDEICGRDY